MKIIIAGAGEVGFHLAKLMAHEAQDIVLIDQNDEVLEHASSHLDVLTLRGDSTSLKVLKEAGAERADMLIAATSTEKTNLITALLAKKMGSDKTIARINNNEYLEQEISHYWKQLGVDSLISTKMLASREIMRLINEACLTDIYEFEKGKLFLIGLTLTSSSLVIDQTLQETAHLNPDSNFKVIAIHRKNQTIIPKGHTKLHEGDHVYFIAKPKGIDEIIKLTGKERKKIKKIMILGGSSIGLFTSQIMEHSFDVKLIEKDRNKAMSLAEQLDETLVIHADGSDAQVLFEEGLETCDAFIAVTGNSETNIIASLIAKNHGVYKTIALVEKAELTNLSHDIGVDTLINRKLIAANNIFRHIRKGRVKDITGLHGVEGEVIEFEVNYESPITQNELKALNFPKSALIAGVVRFDRAFLPSGENKIEPGDKVIVFCLPACINEVEKYFSKM